MLYGEAVFLLSEKKIIIVRLNAETCENVGYHPRGGCGSGMSYPLPIRSFVLEWLAKKETRGCGE